MTEWCGSFVTIGRHLFQDGFRGTRRCKYLRTRSMLLLRIVAWRQIERGAAVTPCPDALVATTGGITSGSSAWTAQPAIAVARRMAMMKPLLRCRPPPVHRTARRCRRPSVVADKDEFQLEHQIFFVAAIVGNVLIIVALAMLRRIDTVRR